MSHPQDCTPIGKHPSGDIAAVVRDAAGGDARAWAKLVTTFDPTLRAVARGFRLGRADVDDVLQNVWLRAFRALGTLREPAAVGGWLVVMTRRESLRTLQRCVTELVTDDPARYDAPLLTTPETELLARERVAALRAAIAALPTHQRRVIGRMLAVPGASYDELADALDVPVGSLGPTRGRALVRLRRDPGLLREASS